MDAEILPLSEEDIKLRYITPAIIAKGWSTSDITMETKVKFTDGKISLQGNLVHREKPMYADYILYFNRNTPIAIVEAKDANHTPAHGIQQAMKYAQRLDVPFAYSSNGFGFVEHDFLTGTEREIPMEQFPTKEELYARYLSQSNNGAGISEDEQKIIQQSYYSDANTYRPRYYQRIAVNRTVNAIARGQNRLLLVMATGTGKTYTAFQTVYRLLKSGMKKKILYLADRNILVDQSIQQDFAPLHQVTHKIDVSKDDKTKITSYQVYFSLYQQLIGQDSKEHYKELFNPEFFDLIIVDECHRGSAKDDSQWRNILEYFKDAAQIGMTATPKETKYQSNITYFGDPIYTYSLKDGIDDGFLAPFRVINITTNIGDEWRPTKGQRDKNGNLIEDRIYNNSDYDYNIVIEDRHREVAEEITKYLQSTDPMAKTIVFCADEEHASNMRQALVNANADICKKNPDYVVRITGSDDYGKAQLDYFISVKEKYPVIATTSKLLSTGVDCKMVKLIVLDQTISSMTEFKQIIGRGTRIRENENKLSFTVMDFRNVTRLFADPEWDGPIEVDPNYPPQPGPNPQLCPVCGKLPCECPKPPCPICGQSPCVCPTEPKAPKPIVGPDGCTVMVVHKVVQIYDSNNKLLRTVDIIDYTKENLQGTYANLSDFISEWSAAEKKGEIAERLKESGIDLQRIKEEQNMADVDDFDFICHIAFGQKPLTRKERADNVKKRDIFSKYGPEARNVLEQLLDKYMNEGITELENPTTVLKLSPLNLIGSPSYITKLFGGSEAYFQAVKELKEYIYQVA